MDIEGEAVERRLRQISDQVVALRRNLLTYPVNQVMIDQLNRERQMLMFKYIRAVDG